MAFVTATWDETKPDGDRAKALGDDDIREMKEQVRERGGVDHDLRSDETGAEEDVAPTGTIGYHKKVTLKERAADLSAVASAFVFYSKDIAGANELFGIDEDGRIIQFTDEGYILGDSVLTSNETYIKGVNVAGNGTVDLIKAGSGNVAVIKAGAELSTSASPTTDAGLVCKKHFDDNNYVPPSGSIQMWAGALASPPSGWLVCDGSTFSATSYPDLAAVVGDKFGAHSGDVYYLPNFTNRFPYGASEGSAAGNASVGSRNTTFASLSGNDNTVTRNYSGGFGYGVGDNGGWYSSYDQMEPYLAVGFIIKT